MELMLWSIKLSRDVEVEHIRRLGSARAATAPGEPTDPPARNGRPRSREDRERKAAMTSLTQTEREWVAIGAAIGAGCHPCTEYHVRAGFELGLEESDIARAVAEALDVRVRGGEAVAAIADGVLGSTALRREAPRAELDLRQTLVGIGAAAGCNAGGLLRGYLAAAGGRGLSLAMLRESLKIAEMVKGRAAEFLRRDAEGVLGATAPVAEAPAVSGVASCCGG
jgi:AhpD family alkylhydroperoxidase